VRRSPKRSLPCSSPGLRRRASVVGPHWLGPPCLPFPQVSPGSTIRSSDRAFESLRASTVIVSLPCPSAPLRSSTAAVSLRISTPNTSPTRATHAWASPNARRVQTVRHTPATPESACLVRSWSPESAQYRCDASRPKALSVVAHRLATIRDAISHAGPSTNAWQKPEGFADHDLASRRHQTPSRGTDHPRPLESPKRFAATASQEFLGFRDVDSVTRRPANRSWPRDRPVASSSRLGTAEATPPRLTPLLASTTPSQLAPPHVSQQVREPTTDRADPSRLPPGRPPKRAANDTPRGTACFQRNVSPKQVVADASTARLRGRIHTRGRVSGRNPKIPHSASQAAVPKHLHRRQQHHRSGAVTRASRTPPDRERTGVHSQSSPDLVDRADLRAPRDLPVPTPPAPRGRWSQSPPVPEGTIGATSASPRKDRWNVPPPPGPREDRLEPLPPAPERTIGMCHLRQPPRGPFGATSASPREDHWNVPPPPARERTVGPTPRQPRRTVGAAPRPPRRTVGAHVELLSLAPKDRRSHPPLVPKDRWNVPVASNLSSPEGLSKSHAASPEGPLPCLRKSRRTLGATP